MGTRAIVALLVGLALVTIRLADAQQPQKIPRIGILSPLSRSPGLIDIDAFRQGLRDLGYIEGQNILIDYRFAEDNYDRLPTLMSELVNLKPDVIFTHTTPGALAAKKATTTIPIVIGAAGELDLRGIVTSLARPGGNITGLTLIGVELEGKCVELLKEAAPKISRVAVLINPANPNFKDYPQNLDDVARSVGVRLQRVVAGDLTALEGTFSSIAKSRSDALLVTNDLMFRTYRKQIVGRAAKNRLPSASQSTDFAEAGGLLQYGPDIRGMFRRAAIYVDKILKGTKPGDLPVERPAKFELVINLKTAKQMGITIPQSVLYRADKVIK
jgi:putative tryptophan/tyrosine transport system substrate-binding protein